MLAYLIMRIETKANDAVPSAPDRRLLKVTVIAALGLALLVTLLFWFVDRGVDQAARGLKGGALFSLAQAISLLADHDWFNIWLFCGFVLGGALTLAQGPTRFSRGLLFLCVTVTATMLIGETLKWFFGRYRPVMLFEHGLYGFSWFAAKGSMHSFPSGHSFRIFSAMTALALLLPRARVPFIALAVLVAASRVLVCRHFPSDVLTGAFLGVCCALWAWRIMSPARDN